MKTTLKSSRRVLSPDQVTEEIRQQIESGTLQPGDRLLSYNEMRALYGVHSVAVQRVYEQLAAEGLIVREKGRGTFVADAMGAVQAAMTLSGSNSQLPDSKPRSGLIGVAGQGFAFQEYSPYWIHLLRGIRAACDADDAQIILLDHLSNKGWEKADGVLICDWSRHFTLQWLPPEMPFVSLMMPVQGRASVYADDYSGGRLVTDYLLKLGHRKIAYIHTRDEQILPKRLAGSHDVLKRAGITPHHSWERCLRGDLDYGKHFADKGYAVMKNWLAEGWGEQGFTAIVAQNDETANGIIRALQEANLRVPEDISVVGFDGVVAQDHGAPLLTTIQVPLEEIGRTAAELLLQQLNGEQVESPHRMFPVTLRAGQSAGEAHGID